MGKKLLVLLVFTVILVSNGLTRSQASADENDPFPDLTSEALYEAYRYIEDERTLSKVEKLYDFDNNSQYLLIEYHEGGYMIFSKITNEYIEYHFETPSPYLDITYKKFYFGPGSYFYQTPGDLNIISVGTEEILSTSEYDNYQDELLSLNQEALASLSEAGEGDAGTEGEMYLGVMKHLVPNRDFFTHSVNMPENTHGTCGYVATSMVLSYFDTYFDSNLIPNQYIDKSSSTYADIENEVWASPSVLDSFIDLLIYLKTGSYPAYGPNDRYGYSINDGANVIEAYLDYIGYQGDYSIYSKKKNIFNNLVAESRSLIYDGYPVMTFLKNSDVFGDNGHVAVAYGYMNGGLVVNFGYFRDMKTVDVNIKGYTIKKIVAFEYDFSNPHVHSDSFLIHDDHSEYCGCGQFIRHHSVEAEPLNPSLPGSLYYHYERCDCTYFRWTLGDHQFTLHNNNLLTHDRTCFCGYTESKAHVYNKYRSISDYKHEIYCACGLVDRESFHNIVTFLPSKNNHYSQCVCGYRVEQDHVIVSNGVELYCEICGYLFEFSPLYFEVPWLNNRDDENQLTI